MPALAEPLVKPEDQSVVTSSDCNRIGPFGGEARQASMNVAAAVGCFMRKQTKAQRQWREKRAKALGKLSKAQMLDALLATWDLMENHHSLTGAGFMSNGDYVRRDDYAVVFPDELSKQVIEKLLPNWWENLK